jgi:hypothetical protein
MSTSTDKQDAKGRSWDQVTKNGTSSAGSMGAGGTGDKMPAQGSQQSATRTDDLLTDGSDKDTGAEGFASASGRVETGLEGIGSMTGGNRQSSAQSGSKQQEASPANSSRDDQQNR